MTQNGNEKKEEEEDKKFFSLTRKENLQT